jgi:hypothetical protein
MIGASPLEKNHCSEQLAGFVARLLIGHSPEDAAEATGFVRKLGPDLVALPQVQAVLAEIDELVKRHTHERKAD